MKSKRDIYLEDLPLSEAWARITAALESAGLWQALPGERVSIADALGRVTAEPIWAAISAPHYHASAMDGYAVRAEDTQGASETNPVKLTVILGEAAAERTSRPAQAVNTGHAMPAWADTVIMVENVQPGDAPDELIIRATAAPWQHVRPMGEDMVATELVLPANHTLRPVDLGALGGSGHASVSVRRKPRVAVIPTGSELVAVENVSTAQPESGQIIEFNSLVMAAQVETWGGIPTRWPIVPDDYDEIKAEVLEAAALHDLVLVNAGSSAGTEDWTAKVIADLGEVAVHGVAVRPGHPVIFGMVKVEVTQASPPAPLSTSGEGEILAKTPRTGEMWGMLKPLAREMRRKPTEAEEALWKILRNRQFHHLKFRRQHAIAQAIVDFFCAELALIVEVDGPIHDFTPEQDSARQTYLEGLGFRMVRVTNDDVLSNDSQALVRIKAAIESARNSPSPLVERGLGGEASQTQEVRLVPVIGVPGYPVSAALTGEIFIEPILSKWLGKLAFEPQTMQATISRKVQSPPGDDDYIRVTVGQVGDQVIATPLSRGAGVITSLVRADGIVRIPRFSEGVDAGAEVSVHLYRLPRDIARTVVHIGSHDMTLDLLAQFLAERAPGTRLSSANVGSLGGLVALKRGEAHLAGAHLLDPDTGEYNWKYIDEYLNGRAVTLITLVRREQGLIVAKGNPAVVTGFDDLVRGDVTFVNRQRGAGTRLLLDYELSKRGIKPEQVRGYGREEFTHLAVAAAVASRTATCGLGVRAASRALNLDFVSVGWERYDLVIPDEFASSALMKPVLDLLHDDAFKQAVGSLEGYDTGLMGQIVSRP